MKNLLLFLPLLLFFFAIDVSAQDAPSGYTTHYDLKKWAENANPSADSLNWNWDEIDQILYDLIVATDSNQMVIENDTLKFSPYIASTDTFTTTATTCTTTVAGMHENDIVVITPEATVYSANDQCSVAVYDGYFIVTRNSSGTSGLVYNYIWIKK